MQFQTVFYSPHSGQILNVIPNKYIRSKHEKLRFCPGYAHGEVNFLYFNSQWPLDRSKNKIHFPGPGVPPVILDESGIPLFCTDRMLKFIQIAAQYQDIVVDLADSMGDQLLRVACVMEAQKKYPDHHFYCTVEPQYREVLSLCPDITLFNDYKAHGLTPAKTGHVIMNGGHLYDPRGKGYNKACVYGTWLNLPFVPYTTRLAIPPGFAERFADFAGRIALPEGEGPVVFQFRSKNWDAKCWDIGYAQALARMIRNAGTDKIYWLGTDTDLPGEFPEFTNLCGKTTWIETVYLLTRASRIFCIDSSIQHLSRALGLKYFCLWGMTHPQQIMGEDPRPQDFCATIDVGPTDIKAITPAQVFARAYPERRATLPIFYDPAMNVSQHGDQEVIFRWFEKHPPNNRIAVDVGAFGKAMSNTFALFELGWSGLLIEANPDRCKVIRDEFHGFSVKVLNVAAGDAAGKMPLHLHSELGHDSLDPAWYPQDLTGKTIDVRVKPLHKILEAEKIPHDFDLLSIDTEGYDSRIIAKLFAASKYRPALIATESTSYENAPALFAEYGYEQIAFTGNQEYGNYIFARKE